MIVSILEYPEDDGPQTLLVDLDKLDLSNPSHQEYYDNIQEAIASPDKAAATSFDASYSYGEIEHNVLVDPPVLVEHDITLYIE